MNAYLFVNQTKIVEVSTSKEGEETSEEKSDTTISKE